MIKQHVEQPDGSEPMGVCDCGFAADECGTNPCMRKKIHLAGLTPGSKWPNTGQPAPAAPSSASVAGDTRSADAPRKALDGAGWPSPILPKCQQCLCTPLHCNCAVYSAYMPAPAQGSPEPVAYVPLSKSERDKGEPIWREVFAAKWRDKDVWRGFDLMALYAKPQHPVIVVCEGSGCPTPDICAKDGCGAAQPPAAPVEAEEWEEVTDGTTMPGDRFSYIPNPETGIGQITSHKRRVHRSSAEIGGHCVKCGAALNGEAAQVGDEIWCHPCADKSANGDLTESQGTLTSEPPVAWRYKDIPDKEWILTDTIPTAPWDLVQALYPAPSRASDATWRCFYCNEVFITKDSAKEHFRKYGDDPACLADRETEKCLIQKIVKAQAERDEAREEIERLYGCRWPDCHTRDLPQTSWMPIDTAPKDGTEFLWSCDNGEYAKKRWSCCVIRWPEYKDCWASGFWMPLPEPPQSIVLAWESGK